MDKSTTKKSGISLVEVLLSLGIFSIFSLGIFYVSVETLKKDVKIEGESEAILYAQEGLEAVTSMRDRNFLLLTNGDYGLALENNLWTFIPAPENIDNFYSRTITIEDVYRDANGNIAANGSLDPNTKKITSEVEWLLRGLFPQSNTLVTYLTNWPGSNWIQTTCTEFENGTLNNMQNLATVAPPDDNCAIELDITETQSQTFYSSDIGDHGNDVAITNGYAYVANEKSSTGLTIVNISNPASMSILSNLDIGGKGRSVTFDGNYAYLGVEKSNAGLAIVNVTNPNSPTITSTLNVGDDGNGLAVSGNYLYMGTDQSSNSFKVINITNKSNPTITASLNFNDQVQSVTINGNYAYLGLEDDNNGFKIVNISTPTAPVVVSTLNVGEEVNSIAINGPYAFVGTEENDESLTVVDISNPNTPTIVETLDVGGEITDISVSGNYLYASIDEQNAGLAAVNISDPLNPYLVYNSDIDGKGTGVASDANFIYLSTDTGNEGLVVKGTTMNTTEVSGDYISEVFDTGSTTTRYNLIEWEHTETAGATVKLQIRTASSEVEIESATWVGADGTNGSFYENSRTEIITDPNASGLRYFQFKVLIDSDGNDSPTVESVTINYSA